jgi:hypothetical protein
LEELREMVIVLVPLNESKRSKETAGSCVRVVHADWPVGVKDVLPSLMLFITVISMPAGCWRLSFTFAFVNVCSLITRPPPSSRDDAEAAGAQLLLVGRVVEPRVGGGGAAAAAWHRRGGGRRDGPHGGAPCCPAQGGAGVDEP